jgi:aryl-alcohol dehydrogenase-like predicted oxidoreductase
MGLAPWGALGGGNFKTDEQRKSQEGRKMGEASPAAIKISKVLERIANNHKVEITSVALAYVMQKTPYVFPIVGGRKLEHLKGNIAGLSLDLSETDMKDIEEANSFDIGFPMNFLGGPSQSFSSSPLPIVPRVVVFSFFHSLNRRFRKQC